MTQVRMSTDGDWGSLGAQMRMEEDGATPAYSDPCRDAKNSPTQSNFSAPDNLQGESSSALPPTVPSHAHQDMTQWELLVAAPEFTCLQCAALLGSLNCSRPKHQSIFIC